MPNHQVIKAQEQMEKKKLNEYYQKRTEDFAESEKVREQEVTDRKHEYRDFLLKQIDDKEKLKQSKKENQFQQQPYSELTDAIEKHTIKVLKQQEERRGLDECVRMKNYIKSEDQRSEARDDKRIAQFCDKRDSDAVIIEDERKDKADRKEYRNDGVALQWTAQKNKDDKNKDLQREKVMDSLIEKQMADLGEECPSDLYEAHEKIRIKRELLRQTEDKMRALLEHLEEAKLTQHQLMHEIAVEEEGLEQELKENGRQKYLLHDTMPNNSHQGIQGNEIKEVTFNYRKQKTQNVSNSN